jgi:L-alanine-DL-glutamate epimerase-like enolase superfamily enzyme
MQMSVGAGLKLARARMLAGRGRSVSRIQLRFDTNSGDDASPAVPGARVAEGLGVNWSEGPGPLDDLPGTRRHRAATGIRLAAGASKTMDNGPLHLGQPAVARAGGAGCRRIAALAGAFHRAGVSHWRLGSAVCRSLSAACGRGARALSLRPHAIGQSAPKYPRRRPEPVSGSIKGPRGLGWGANATKKR